MMETYQRKAKMTELKKYDHFAKDGDFIEVCEWHNGEGFDVTIGTNKQFQLTSGEFEALVALVYYKE
jgi:hypothetical protein